MMTLDEIADAFAEILSEDPERIQVEPAGPRSSTGLVCLTVKQAERILAKLWAAGL